MSRRQAFGTYSTRPSRQHKVVEPKIEPPKVEVPKIEPPKIEPPKIEPPKVEPPKVEQLEPIEKSFKSVQITIRKFPDWNECYWEKLSILAPSVINALEDRFVRKQYDYSKDDEEIHEILDRSLAAYERKRERGRLASKLRREKDKIAKINKALENEQTSE